MESNILPLYSILQLLFYETNALQNIGYIIDTPLLDLSNKMNYQESRSHQEEK